MLTKRSFELTQTATVMTYGTEIVTMTHREKLHIIGQRLDYGVRSVRRLELTVVSRTKTFQVKLFLMEDFVTLLGSYIYYYTNHT